MSDFLSGIGDFASNVGSSISEGVGGLVDSLTSDEISTTQSTFDSLWDTGSKAFNWIEEHPISAQFAGGAALGLLKYRESERERKEDRQIRQEKRDYESQFGGASSGEVIDAADTGFSKPTKETQQEVDPGENLLAKAIAPREAVRHADKYQ